MNQFHCRSRSAKNLLLFITLWKENTNEKQNKRNGPKTWNLNQLNAKEKEGEREREKEREQFSKVLCKIISGYQLGELVTYLLLAARVEGSLKRTGCVPLKNPVGLKLLRCRLQNKQVAVFKLAAAGLCFHKSHYFLMPSNIYGRLSCHVWNIIEIIGWIEPFIGQNLAFKWAVESQVWYSFRLDLNEWMIDWMLQKAPSIAPVPQISIRQGKK